MPIKGNIVLIQHCPSDEAFKNVFLVQPPDDRKTLGEFYLQIACNINLPLKQRKIAVLMIIIRSIVMPSSDKNYLPTAFISLLEDEDSVSKYAWGAALLSFLLTGIENFGSRHRKHLDGNFWVVLVSISLNYLFDLFF